MDTSSFDNLFPILTTILVLGGIWVVIRAIFKITMKIFMFGCLGIILFAVFSMAVSALGMS